MSALATRAAPVFGASAAERPFLKRQRGVTAAIAPAACGEMSREKFAARRVVATGPSAPPAPKRACRGFDVKIREERFAVSGKDSVVHASASERLKQRIEAERDALGSLLKKAALLVSRKDDARKSTQSKPASSEATKQSIEQKKRQPVVQRAAQGTTKGSTTSWIDQAKEAMKKRRQAEIARAREKFRQELLELEKAAMPDETIYPEDLEELGIAPFQYDVSCTRKHWFRINGGGLHVGGV